MPQCFVQCVVCMYMYTYVYIYVYTCVYMYIYLLEIDIPSETSYRSDWCIAISFIFLICEVYGTNYLSPDVCQIWIKALVRNTECIEMFLAWKIDKSFMTYHNILCLNQHPLDLSCSHPFSLSLLPHFLGGYDTILL